MTQLTLPGLARTRRDLRAEAAIPCATGARTTATATHLTDDRRREPSFDDLITGNRREPSHADLLADAEDDQDLTPAARTLPIAYPGAGADALAWLRKQDVDGMAAVAAHAAAWLREQDPANKQLPAPAPAAPGNEQPAPRDEHAFDYERLVPAGGLLTLDPASLRTADQPPAMPVVGEPRLLFDALDTLDRLPALYAVDDGSFEMEAGIAAIQTYAALRPDLLDRHELRMHLAPLAAQLAEPDPEASNHTGQLAAAWTSIREAHTRFASHDSVHDRHFNVVLKLDAVDEAVEELTDATGDVRAVFDAEADDIELLAVEAGLPPLADWERELLALPEGELDPGAERAFADMDATSDAIDDALAEVEVLDARDAESEA